MSEIKKTEPKKPDPNPNKGQGGENKGYESADKDQPAVNQEK